MLGYLLLQSKTPDSFSDSEIESYGRLAINSLDSSLIQAVWVSNDRRTACLSWATKQNGFWLKLAPNASFHFFHGYVREGSRCWNYEDLVEFNLAHPEAVIDTSSFGGVFCMVSVRPGEIVVQTPISNLYHCNRAGNERLTVLASKAQIAHTVVSGNQRPAIDLQRIASIGACRWLTHSETPYADVVMLPAHSRVTADAGGSIKVVPLGTLGFDGQPSEISNTVISDVAHELLLAMAPLGERPTLGITGGRDSRLMLAAAHRLDLVEHTFTIGATSHPDVLIGARVAKQLGLTHKVDNPITESRLPDLERLRSASAEALFRFDLQRSAWNPAYSSDMAFREGWSGYGGELLRGGFLKGKSEASPDLHTSALNQFNHYFLRFDDILTEQAQTAHRSRLRNSYLSRLGEAAFPGHLLDECYLRLRCGVWAAASQMRFANPRPLPLCDNRLLRLVYSSTNTAQRANDALVKAVTTMLAPELKEIPTIADEKIVRTMEQPRNIDVKESSFWKYAAPTALDPEFRAVILSPEADRGGLWDIISFDRLAALYHTGEIFDNARIRQLWSIYSLALVCSGQWMTPRECRTVPVPHSVELYQTNWAKIRRRIQKRLSKKYTASNAVAGSSISREVRSVLSATEVESKVDVNVVLDTLGLRLKGRTVTDVSGRTLSLNEIEERLKPLPLVRSGREPGISSENR